MSQNKKKAVLAKILNRSKDLCNENGDKLINSKS